MPSVSVVIVNWNAADYIGECLDGLLRQSREPDEVVVVDNASTDGSGALLAARYPHVHLVRSRVNLGFAAGCNLGIRSTRGEYVATLNADAQPERDWLKALVEAMAADSRLGMCASLMLFKERPEIVNSAGIALDVLGIAWDRLGGRPASEATAPAEVFGPCAGAALYRREMLERLGGFDEDFFMYLEDVDLAWRAQAAGWRCRFVPGARVYHAHSAAAGEGSAFKNYLKARNKVWLIAKNYPWPQVALWGPLILLYDALAVAFAYPRGGRSSLRGRLDGLKALPAVLAKRRRQSQSRTPGWQDVRPRLHGPSSPWTIRQRFAHLDAYASPARHP